MDDKNKQSNDKQTKVKIKQNSGDDLHKEINDKQEKLASLTIDHKLGKLKNLNELKMVRRDIARLKTKLSLAKFVIQNPEKSEGE